jgi:hypothetical protein
MHVERGAVALILPSRAAAPVVLPVTQVNRQLEKVSFTSNRTRPTTKSHTFLLQKNQTKATGNDGWDFRCAEKKGGNPTHGYDFS